MILIATDFSEYSQRTVQVGVRIAKATGTKIVLIHNIYSEINWKKLTRIEKKEHPEMRNRIQHTEDRFSELLSSHALKNIEVTRLITFGIAYVEIVKAAQKMKADMIIIGSHGNEASERFFIGSTVQKVLRQATCPVLTVKKDASYAAWKNMVFASDLYGKIEKPFKQVLKLINALKTTVHLVIINRPTDFLTTREAQSRMDDFIKKYPDVEFRKVLYCHHSIEGGVIEYAEDIHADVIALITHNRSRKPGYLIGNTETLAFRSTVPILSLNILPEPIK